MVPANDLKQVAAGLAAIVLLKLIHMAGDLAEAWRNSLHRDDCRRQLREIQAILTRMLRCPADPEPTPKPAPTPKPKPRKPRKKAP